MQILLASLMVWAVVTGPEPDDDGATARIRCDIQIIHATRGAEFVDPALRPLARYLEASFGSRYQSFKLLNRSPMTLSRNERSGLQLPNNTELVLTYLGNENEQLRLTMEVGSLRTTVKVHDGGLFFQAGRRYQGGMLVVAIRARNSS